VPRPHRGLALPERVVWGEIATHIAMALDRFMLSLYDAVTNRQHHDARLGRTVELDLHNVEGRALVSTLVVAGHAFCL
jgi:hypothetical protein